MASISYFLVQISKYKSDQNNKFQLPRLYQYGEGSTKHYENKKFIIIDLWLEIKKFIEAENNELLIQINFYDSFPKIDEKFLDIL